MIKPKQVPKEAVEAARKFMRLQALSDEWIDDLLAAALNAWPGMKPCVAFTGDQSKEWPDEHVEKHMGPAILLPVPQENSNERE